MSASRTRQSAIRLSTTSIAGQNTGDRGERIGDGEPGTRQVGRHDEGHRGDDARLE